MMVILVDNILTYSIMKHVEAFKKQDSGAKKLLKKVGDHERFGMASQRMELEITSVNNMYMQRSEMTRGFVEEGWTNTGTFESLQYANKLLLDIENEIIK